MDSVSFLIVWAGAAVVAVVLLVVIIALVLVLRRRPPEPPPKPSPLEIDVFSLDSKGPSGAFPQLVFSGVPVRLAALVVAPVGRSGEIPEADPLLDAVDQLIPGLVEIISLDSPTVKFWPGQLSTHGFAHAFFRNVKLPGTRGVDTSWCSVAGKFKSGGKIYLAGLLCAAAAPNELTEVAVEDNDQWARVLKVRRA